MRNRRRSLPGRGSRRSPVKLAGAIIIASAAIAGCKESGSGGSGRQRADSGPPVARSALSGGDTTVFDTSTNAFSFPAANLTAGRQDAFFVGNSVFNRNWVTAPSSTDGLDGLGPVFNAASCSACHFHDGRGRPPVGNETGSDSILFRLSIPGETETGAPLPDPVYGDQLNHRAILGVAPEGNVQFAYEENAGAFEDGEAFSLREPAYTFTDLAFGPLAAGLLVSPRVAPALMGLGLLAAVPEETVLALADEDDDDADGISGRPNRVWDLRRGELALGRFGWKANQPTLEQQNAGAFLGDIGITSTLLAAENCAGPQADCLAAPNGGQPEVDQEKLDFLTFYTMTLAVPARRGLDDSGVARGEKLFSRARCSHCHTPTLETGEVDGFPELSRQTIHPFTDLLLHDMGDGLADGRDDFQAGGREWRTPPLWGLGLVETVSGHTLFLHDGRARSFSEAILWHGGEAEDSREAFLSMTKRDRDALLAFLASL